MRLQGLEPGTACRRHKLHIPRFRLRRKLAHFAASPLPITNASLVCDWSYEGLLHLENRTKKLHDLEGRLHFSCRSSPRAISTDQLHTLLRFHLLPINQVVFLGPYSLKDERSHLRGCFTLRCLQRLSRPYIATQLCRWHDNWCTRGTSIPVLSY